jgi:hypothetical protein
MIIAQEPIGPYTIVLAVIMLVGLPVAAKFLRRAVRLEAGPLKAELGELHEHVQEAAAATNVVKESVGVANGDGSLQDQVTQLTVNDRHKMADLTELRTDVASLASTMGEMQRFQRATAVGQAQLSTEVETNAGRLDGVARLVRALDEKIDSHITAHELLRAINEQGRAGKIERRDENQEET